MNGIKFKIPNKYCNYLYEILMGIDFEDSFWKIEDEEVYKDDGGDLFCTINYNNNDFKQLISTNIYYTIFLKLQLYMEKESNYSINNFNDFLNSDCELILFITDNEYVEIYSKNSNMLNIIMNNAKLCNFSNIEMIVDISKIRKTFSAYSD
ncbi:MAG: DUF2691 family protein [Bacilli bacterium]|nr:DUF2691 family protein [Bacilli bacterium]